MFAKIASDQLFRQLDHMDTGRLAITTPDGVQRVFGGAKPGAAASITLHDWRVVGNFIRHGDIGLADDYRSGRWETDDLTTLITLGLINRRALNGFVMGSKLSRLASVLSYLFRANTLTGSRRNIHAHYDLGNDFYRLWLDPGMSYSAAMFRHPAEDLQTAQDNKYDRILDCLDTRSGSLLEIGCGWGGFAERALGRGDFGVRGITLSDEQLAFARARLQGHADIALQDYRHQRGTFDNIVSIEMFEAVGERFWPTYFNRVGSLLNKGGRAVIQTITMNEQDFPQYRRGGDFIRSYIFPGGMLPSPSRFDQEAARAGLKTGNQVFFGQDYARTLEHWLRMFDANHDRVAALGFDEGFIRLWRFYLAGCIAGFRTGRTNVMQTELRHV